MSFVWPLALIGLALVPLAIAMYVLAHTGGRSMPPASPTRICSPTSSKRRRTGAATCPPHSLLALTACSFGRAARVGAQGAEQEATVVLVTDNLRFDDGDRHRADADGSRPGGGPHACGGLAGRLSHRPGHFSTAVRTVVAPTTDKAALDAALDSLKPVGGTALGDASSKASLHRKSRKKSRRTRASLPRTRGRRRGP